MQKLSANEYLKYKAEICEVFHMCTDCPLRNDNSYNFKTCIDLEMSTPELAIKRVEEYINNKEID
jgi:hypothetical protein